MLSFNDKDLLIQTQQVMDLCYVQNYQHIHIFPSDWEI